MNLDFQGLWLHVELLATETERKTPSGIALPESWHPSQDSTAFVLAAGSGLLLDNGDRIPTMCEPGDLIQIEYGDFHPLLGGDGRQGFVWEPNVLAWLACDPEDSTWDRILPLNEWVLIVPDQKPTSAGDVLLTDKAKRPRSGKIEGVGPGHLITCGDHRGQRLSCEDICGGELVGRRVHWSETAPVVCAGRFKLTWVLIKASDLIAVENLMVTDLVMSPKHWDLVRDIGRVGAYGGRGAL